MDVITIDQLRKSVPNGRPEDLTTYLEALNEALTRYEVDTPRRVAAFLAQVAHESGDFRHTQENLNYSWQGLRRTWPSRFSTDEVAQAFHRQPEKIANHVYANHPAGLRRRRTPKHDRRPSGPATRATWTPPREAAV